jgi:hypothetical protein
MSPLPFDDLEHVYEHLAQAIDRAGPANEALFLTKLALVLAHELGDRSVVERAIATALADLPTDKASAISTSDGAPAGP